MSGDIVFADATELACRIREGQVSPTEVLAEFTDRIEAVNPGLRAIVTRREQAQDEAMAAERAVAAGGRVGPLCGVPFTVKDCIDTAGIRTTRGSLLFADRVPDADATVVARLRRAGGIMVGKTNMPEFALDAESSNLIFGTTANPWDPARSAGGSSGGEAAAIAAGLSPLGIGSDVGGSIRIPASFNGIVGLKATHGRIPLTGHWPDILLASMHVGPMARSVRDIALALSLMAGPDGIDANAAGIGPPAGIDLSGPLSGLRLAFSPAAGFSPVDHQVSEAVVAAAGHLADMGARMEQSDLRFLTRHDYQAEHIFAFNFEAVPAIERLGRGREDELAPSTRWFVEAGAPSWKRYLLARSRIGQLKADTGELLRDHHALIAPTSPMPAFPHGQPDHPVNGRAVPRFHVTKTTSPWDYTGSPALSVPFGWTRAGLPIGVQVIGRRFDEATVLRIGAALEKGAPGRGRTPPPGPRGGAGS